jgi:hypothetical protein
MIREITFSVLDSIRETGHMLQRTMYSALQYRGLADARFPRGSFPSSGISGQIRRPSRIGPKEGGSGSRNARPRPDTAARTDRIWRKSRQPSYVRLRSRTPATQGVLDQAADGARAAGAEVTSIRLSDFELPIYDADWEAEHGLPKGAQALKTLLADDQGLLIATPEHNGGYTAECP